MGLDSNSSNGLAENGLNYFKPYDSQLSIPETKGTRIVKCLYQISPKTGKKLRENSYIRIPTNHISEELLKERLDDIMPFVVDFFLDKEEAMIKEEHKKGVLNIHSNSLSIDKILEYLEANETSGRLNKEMIEEWFDTYIKDNLAELFAAKMGLTADSSETELEKLEQVLAAYRLKLSGLASPKVSMKEEDCLALIKVIEKADSEKSLLGNRFIKKLTDLNKKAEVILMEL